MSSKNLVICDPDSEYAARLAVYFSGKRELVFQVKTCSCPQQIQPILEKGTIDFLMLAEEFYEPYPDEVVKTSGKLILLSSEKREICADSCPSVFKYQPAENIFTELLQICAKEKQEDILKIRKDKEGRIIGFYSPVRRLGQTAMALEMSRELSKKENVLYLNLETYAGIDGYFPDETQKNLSVLLYYLKQETRNLGLILAGLICQCEGVDYIPPVQIPDDLKEISADEWIWLFEEILTGSIYDVLILDIGESIQGIVKILNVCDEIYMPVSDDRFAASKIRQFERMLLQSGSSETAERVVRCDFRRTAAGKNYEKARSIKGNRR